MDGGEEGKNEDEETRFHIELIGQAAVPTSKCHERTKTRGGALDPPRGGVVCLPTTATGKNETIRNESKKTHNRSYRWRSISDPNHPRRCDRPARIRPRTPARACDVLRRSARREMYKSGAKEGGRGGGRAKKGEWGVHVRARRVAKKNKGDNDRPGGVRPFIQRSRIIRYHHMYTHAPRERVSSPARTP